MLTSKCVENINKNLKTKEIHKKRANILIGRILIESIKNDEINIFSSIKTKKDYIHIAEIFDKLDGFKRVKLIE